MLEQAASFYERHLWESAAGAPVRDYLAAAGSARPSAASSVSASRRAPGCREGAREGIHSEELRGAGLTNARGNDYFPQRLMFPLADARGRIVGFQARKLHDDDPLRGSTSTRPRASCSASGDPLRAPSRANGDRKQGRAIVVEGNTDVMALRQAGFEPVVASMGTALTEQQLQELRG